MAPFGVDFKAVFSTLEFQHRRGAVGIGEGWAGRESLAAVVRALAFPGHWLRISTHTPLSSQIKFPQVSFT